MHFTESDYSDLLSLFDYVGKKILVNGRKSQPIGA